MSGVVVVVLTRADGGPADLSVVDALARLELTLRRHGWTVRVAPPCDDVRGLLEFVGLDEVICSAESDGETEGREQLGEQEVVEPDDPTA